MIQLNMRRNNYNLVKSKRLLHEYDNKIYYTNFKNAKIIKSIDQLYKILDENKYDETKTISLLKYHISINKHEYF